MCDSSDAGAHTGVNKNDIENTDSILAYNVNFQVGKPEEMALDPSKNEDDGENTDSTITYNEDFQDVKLEENAPDPLKNEINMNLNNSLDFRSFSPLPSTSSDNITIDLNDTRFNKATSTVPILSEDVSVDTEMQCDSNSTGESNPTKDSDTIIECSSGSEIEYTQQCISLLEEEVIKSLASTYKKRKRSTSRRVIDLLNETSQNMYDSDCEIVNVDQLIAENNAALNLHSNTDCEIVDVDRVKPVRHALKTSPAATDCEIVDVDRLVAGNDAVLDLPSTSKVIQLDSIADTPRTSPATICPQVDLVPENCQIDERLPNVFEKMRTIVRDFFDKHKSGSSSEEKTNPRLLPESVLMASTIKIPSTLQASREYKRMKLRDRCVKNKRPRVVETIDLSRNYFPHRRTISEVIDIDSDTSSNSTNVQSADSTSDRVTESNVQPHLSFFHNNRLLKSSSPHKKNQHRVFYKYVSHLSSPQNILNKTKNNSHNTFYKYVSHSSTSPNNSPVNNPPHNTATENLPPDDIITNKSSQTGVVNNMLLDSICSQNKEPIAPAKQFGECPVCLEPFTQGNAVSTFCGHIFCATCMNKIKVTSKKCPKCRKPLKGKGFHPIFL